MRLHIDTVPYPQKPNDSIATIKARLQRDTPPRNVTVDELATAIQGGYSFSPAVVIGGAKAENWKEQQLFCVDIDNDSEDAAVLAPEQALEICRQNDVHPILYYFSFSHTEKKPKYRLCFATDEVITDPNTRSVIMETLISLFPQADKACRNADRIFYGTNKDLFICDRNARITLETIKGLFTPPERKTPTGRQASTDEELSELKRNFDFLGYLKGRNGKISFQNARCVQFENCEICGHRKDLVYYHDTNMVYCFHKTDRAYSIIDYIMETENIPLSQAISHFKHDLCGVPRTTAQKWNPAKSKHKAPDKIISRLQELQADSRYSLNDKGIAQLFSDLYQDCLVYCTTAKQWYHFNGKVWQLDGEAMHTRRKAKEFADGLLIFATSLPENEYKKTFSDYAYSLQTLRVREIIIKDAQSNNFVSQSDFDRNTDLLNCQNGTLHLKTFAFTPHDPKDLLSKISNVVYDEKVASAAWEKFIDGVMMGDREKIEYLQKVLGYAITADTRLETCFILYGASTRNGKSTLVETIAYMLGNTSGYAMNILPQTLAQKNKDTRQASGDIARLHGCRFLNAAEPPKRMIFDVALLKELLGRDTITARHLFEREFEFRPHFKLFINTNFLPLITDDTLFSSSRLNVISFDKHFTPQEQDRDLKDRLQTAENISGILNWCIAGLKKFYTDGAIPPPSVQSATAEYRANSDKLGNFIAECLERSDCNTKALIVFTAYKTWCEINGYGCENKGNFYDELRGKNIFAKTGTVNGQTVKNVVIGYEVIEEEPPPFRPHTPHYY